MGLHGLLQGYLYHNLAEHEFVQEYAYQFILFNSGLRCSVISYVIDLTGFDKRFRRCTLCMVKVTKIYEISLGCGVSESDFTVNVGMSKTYAFLPVCHEFIVRIDAETGVRFQNFIIYASPHFSWTYTIVHHRFLFGVPGLIFSSSDSSCSFFSAWIWKSLCISKTWVLVVLLCAVVISGRLFLEVRWRQDLDQLQLHYILS
jgi:hypothetical protein